MGLSTSITLLQSRRRNLGRFRLFFGRFRRLRFLEDRLWGQAKKLPALPVKMTLVAESDLEGGVRDPKLARAQKFEPLFDAALQYELRRRRTGRILEDPGKMSFT
jgi:hypothetical protein